jgi:hypothetical protein
MKAIIIAVGAGLVLAASPAAARWVWVPDKTECAVADPTGTPLNVRGTPPINQSITNPTFKRRIEEKASERRSGFSPEFFASCAWTKRPCF